MPRLFLGFINVVLTGVRGQDSTTERFNPFSTTTSTTNPGQQEGRGINRYNCQTLTCELYEQDEWEAIKGENSTRDCHSAIETEFAKFELEAEFECNRVWKLSLPWAGCRQKYCQMFQNVLEEIRPNKNQYFYEGCEPILHFNYTLCLTEYRDADAFCGCLCNGMHLMNTGAACFSQYIAHLTWGRRGFDPFFPTAICTLDLCGVFSNLADPRVMQTLIGVPSSCAALDLPFDRQNCAALIDTRPYDPCPWVKKTAPEDELLCTDGTYCSVAGDGSWACCAQGGGRMLCPENYPFMCASPLKCVGSSDYCCVADELECGPEGVRTCSLILDPVLPEWYGISWRDPNKKTPEELAELYPDKYGPQAQFPKTTKKPSESTSIQQDSSFTLSIAIGAAAVSLVLIVFIAIRVSGVTFGHMTKTTNVFGRALANCSGEPQAQFRPSHDDDQKKKKPRWAKNVAPAGMPSFTSSGDVEVGKSKGKQETAAFQHLRRLTMRIKKRGSLSSIAEHQELAEAVKRAEGQANAKMSPDDAGELIAFSRQQLAIQTNEQVLTAHTKAIDVDIAATDTDYLPARPGGKTVADQDRSRAEQAEAWQRFDTLRLAAVEAQSVGANPVLLDRAQGRVDQFVGRTVELPEERCVLDPEGKGLRLLQPGMQRATDPYSGEAYTWDTYSYSACFMAREGLGGVDNESASPVCASFAQRGYCSLGQRCAWRHVRPQAGDRIREPIQLS